MIVLLMISTLFMATTCDDSTVYTTRVVLVNNTEEPIYVAQFSFDKFDEIVKALLYNQKDRLKRIPPMGGVRWRSCRAY